MRRQIVDMIFNAKKGHIGGALSCTDILVTLFYGHILRYDARDPHWPERDRFILSKGHSGVALFSILADLGYFDSSELAGFCQDGRRLGGHPDKSIPGIEADTGSLGHGLGIGTGMSLSAKMDNKQFLTIVLLGDGECYEGSVWEAALFASHHRLKNLVAIIDRNGQCVTDFTEDCVRLEPLAEKWKGFGWDVINVYGHSFEELLGAMNTFRDPEREKPLLMIANTIKGKGVSFMERQLAWHHSIPSPEEFIAAKKELDLDDWHV